MSLDKQGEVAIIRFTFNEISLDQREKLKKELYLLVSNGDGKKVIINLARVGFLSSLLIALIVFFAKEVRKKQGNVKLAGLSDEALSLFQLTQLDKVFELYDTEHDALESFKNTD